MKERTDFFQVGGTLSEDAPSYIERSADDELMAALRRGELCLVLAPRQTGKSSLMVHARKRLKEQGVSSGFIDLQSLGKEQDPDRFFNSVINQVARTLDLEADPKEWYEARQSISATERFTNFMEDVALSEIKGDVALFFDEIDSILKLPFSDDFFTTVRSMVNARAINPKLKRLTFVFLGTTTKSSFIKDRSRTPFNIGTDILLKDFDRHKTESFKRVLGEDSGELVDRIFYWTNGQPLLVQKLAAAAYSWPIGERTNARLDEEVERSYLRKNIDQDTHLKFIRDYLLGDPAGVRETLSTYRDVLDGREVAEDSQSPVQDRLRLAGVVKAEGGRLVPRNPIYTSIFNERWVRENTPANTYRLVAYAAPVVLAVVLLWVFLLQSKIFPSFPSTDRLVRYTAEPSIYVDVPVGDASYAYVDGQEAPISNGVARITLGSLTAGKENHTVKLVGGWFSKTREIPLEVVYYPNWEIRQFPDARLNSINQVLEIDGRTVNVKDVRNGETLTTLAGHGANVTTAIKSSFSGWILTGAEDGSLKVWPVKGPESFPEPKNGLETGNRGGGAVRSAAFAPFENIVIRNSIAIRVETIASGTEDGSLNLIKVEKPELDLSPQGNSNTQSARPLANPDQQVKLIPTSFKDHHGAVLSVAFASDGKKLVSGSRDGTVTLWSVEDGGLRRIGSSTEHRGAVFSVAFVPGQEQFASGGEDGAIKLWDAATGKVLSTLSGHAGAVRSISFSFDGRFISGGDDATVRVWRTTNGEVQHVFQFDEPLRGVFFPSAQDSKIILAQGVKNTLRVWDSLTYKEIQVYAGHQSSVKRVVFSPDGRRIVSASDDGTLKLWDADTGRELQAFPGHTDSVEGVAFSPDGRRIISAGGYGSLKLWDADTGRELQTFSGNGGVMQDVAFSPDGKRIVSASSDGTLNLRDADTGREVQTFSSAGSAVQEVAFSPDGRRIVSASDDGSLKLWDADTGRELQTFSGNGGVVQDIAFSPDGKRIVSASSDGTLKLWDADAGRELRTFTGHTRVVVGVTFSPDGRRIVSASYDGSLKLWDAETGQELRTFSGGRGQVLDAAFSPDGTMVISGNSAGSLTLWWAAF